MSKTVLETLEKSAEVLPFMDIEAMVGNLIVFCKIYCDYPVVTNDDFDNPEIFKTISDIMLMDCSLTSLNHTSMFYSTVCSGHNTIDVVFYADESKVESAGTVHSPHYCFTNSNLLSKDWFSYIDWDKFGLTNECKDFINYKSSSIFAFSATINTVNQCRYCGTMFMPYFGLEAKNLLTIYEKHHGVIANG